MRGGFRIGRLFGIDLAVDWSWLFVFLLMSWNLTVVFGTWHPSWSTGASAVLAVIAALLFFASVLTHELGHALVARGFGMKVREIRLFLFGGVSNLEREPPSPKAEFWMAIAGPLVSLALGIGFIVVAATMIPTIEPTHPVDSLARLGPLATLFSWLGPVNLTVGLFNLLPGFPLDGGRVLRAALWKISGDLHRATFAATTVGRTLGWAFIVVGVAMVFGAKIPYFGQGAGSGIWLAFIGWFLSSAAERSFGALLVEEVLEGVAVGHLMRRSGPAVPAEASVRETVETWFRQSADHGFPVIDHGHFLGLVSDADLRKVPLDVWDRTRVTEIMTPRDKLVSLTEDDEAESALRRFGSLDVDQLPVLVGDVLVGILSRSDITRWLEIHLSKPRPRRTPRTA